MACTERFWGYSLIGAWRVVDPVHFAETLGGAGLTVTEIELDTGLGGPPDPPVNPSGSQNDPLPPEVLGPTVLALAEACKANKVVLWVCMTNWNGPLTRALEDSHMIAWCDWISENLDPKWTVVLSVSEPDNGDEKALRWQHLVDERLGGQFTMVGNGPGGRGEPEVPSDFTDWHHCEEIMGETFIPVPTINNTDCGSLIGIQKDVLSGMVEACNPGHFTLYTFDGEPDEEAIGVISAGQPEGLCPPVVGKAGSGKVNRVQVI